MAQSLPGIAARPDWLAHESAPKNFTAIDRFACGLYVLEMTI